MAHNSGLPQPMLATAQVPASSSTSTASSMGAAMASLRPNHSESGITLANNLSSPNTSMIGASRDAVMNNRLPNSTNDIVDGSHQQQSLNYRNMTAMEKTGPGFTSKGRKYNNLVYI